jgi:hypothetical protein
VVPAAVVEEPSLQRAFLTASKTVRQAAQALGSNRPRKSLSKLPAAPKLLTAPV